MLMSNPQSDFVKIEQKINHLKLFSTNKLCISSSKLIVNTKDSLPQKDKINVIK